MSDGYQLVREEALERMLAWDKPKRPRNKGMWFGGQHRRLEARRLRNSTLPQHPARPPGWRPS